MAESLRSIGEDNMTDDDREYLAKICAHIYRMDANLNFGLFGPGTEELIAETRE